MILLTIARSEAENIIKKAGNVIVNVKDRKYKFRGKNMIDLEEFYERYPIQKMTLSSGKSFAYRYYKNPNALLTIQSLHKQLPNF